MTNINRVELYKQLPLDVPFSVHIFPIYMCNFKCNYCIHSLSEEQLAKMNFKKQIMSLEIYKKAIDDLTAFSKPLKALLFAGHGEPLLHSDIAEMVAYAKQKKVAERIEIVTNASLLTKELSDKLISAGLDRIKISVQGISKKKYEDVCGINIDYDKFIENITYFYEHKINTDVYIKIIDVALDSREDEKIFYDIFKPISDSVAIEYAIPFVEEIDEKVYGKEFDKCKQGNKPLETEVCSMPFYMMVVEPSGQVVPCCSTEVPFILGNIKENSLIEIWNSDKRKMFLLMQLKNRSINTICKKCTVPQFGLQEGDYLDAYKNELIKYYK